MGIIKYTFQICNIVLAAASFTYIALSAYIWGRYGEAIEILAFGQNKCIHFLIIGIVCLLISAFSFFVGMKLDKTFLQIEGGIMVIFLVCQFVILIGTINFTTSKIKKINRIKDEMYGEIRQDEALIKLFDDMQSKNKCCGVRTNNDYSIIFGAFDVPSIIKSIKNALPNWLPDLGVGDALSKWAEGWHLGSPASCFDSNDVKYRKACGATLKELIEISLVVLLALSGILTLASGTLLGLSAYMLREIELSGEFVAKDIRDIEEAEANAAAAAAAAEEEEESEEAEA